MLSKFQANLHRKAFLDIMEGQNQVPVLGKGQRSHTKLINYTFSKGVCFSSCFLTRYLDIRGDSFDTWGGGHDFFLKKKFFFKKKGKN